MFKSVSRPPKYNNHAVPTSPTSTTASTTKTSDLYSATAEPQLIVTRHHLKQSVDAYSELLKNAATYSSALNAMNTASAGFADALEKASRVKGNGHADTLLTASGIHYLIANQNQILSSTIERYLSPLLPCVHSRASFADQLAI